MGRITKQGTHQSETETHIQEVRLLVEEATKTRFCHRFKAVGYN